MNKTTQLSKVIFTLSILLVLTTSTNAQTTDSHIPDSYGFVVEGTNGNPVMLDRTWYQEAKSDGNKGWTRSMRTMSGNELSTTVITYKKKPTKDLMTNATMIMVFVQTLTNDNIKVPINWVNEAGEASTAPKGLEHIKEANGATGVVTYATLTPLTGSTAFGLNFVKFAGLKGWKSRTTVDILAYFSSFGAMKGCVVVDNKTNIGAVYDGISTNPTEYPTLMPNYAPHQGALNGIRFN